MPGDEKYYPYNIGDRDIIIEVVEGKVSVVYDMSRGIVSRDLIEMTQKEFDRAVEPLKRKEAKDIGESAAYSVLRHGEYAP